MKRLHVDRPAPSKSWPELNAQQGPMVGRICQALRSGTPDALDAVAADVAGLVLPAGEGLQCVWVWTAHTVRRYTMLAEGELTPTVVAAIRYLVREAGAQLVIHTVGMPKCGGMQDNIVALECPQGRGALHSRVPGESESHVPSLMSLSEPLPSQPRWFDENAAPLAAESRPIASAVLAEFSVHAEEDYRSRRGGVALMATPPKVM